MSVEALYVKPTEVSDAVVRGLGILNAGLYQIREAGNQRGWTAEFSPKGHRDVAYARRWLREQQVARDLVVRTFPQRPHANRIRRASQCLSK